MSDAPSAPPRTRRRSAQDVAEAAPTVVAQERDTREAPPATDPLHVRQTSTSAFPTRQASLDGLREGMDMDAAALDALMRGYLPPKGASLPRQGQRVRGTVSRVTADTVFVDLGHKADAAIDRVECEADVAPGSVVEAWVLNSKHGELRLTRTLAGADARDMLEEAARSRIPVQGKVASANDHGVSVVLAGGTRAFCPLSHLAPAGTTVDPAGLVGQTLAFHVLEVRGREAVVSHRAIAEEAARAAQAAAFATVQEGEVHEAVVVTIREFGAFVRLANGAEGLVHLSNLSRKRVEKVEDAVSVGQTVRVKVLKVDTARARLDLGMKQADDTGGADAPRGRTADPALRSGDPSLGSLGALLAGVTVRTR